VVLLAGYLATGDDRQPIAPPQASAPPTGFVAPSAGIAGQRITVLAFRDTRLCGPAELRFHGAPIARRPAGDVSPPDLHDQRVFLSVTIPPSATPGNHQIDLYGPIPGGHHYALCADIPEHQGHFATATVLVRARR
jgi:hypothetical protein